LFADNNYTSVATFFTARCPNWSACGLAETRISQTYAHVVLLQQLSVTFVNVVTKTVNHDKISNPTMKQKMSRSCSDYSISDNCFM